MQRLFVIRQEKFEGPLDLLFELIEKEKLPINEISLARVTEDFLSEVKQLQVFDRENLAEFLVIAAQLMLLKSRSLLPHLLLSEEEEESLDDLKKRLEEYAQLKELAKELRKRASTKSFLFSREPFLGITEIFYPPPKIQTTHLGVAFSALLASIPTPRKLGETRLKKVISLDEKIKEIKKLLEMRVERAFSEMIKEGHEKVEVIVSFLAILELAKQKVITLYQEEAFTDIIVKPAA